MKVANAPCSWGILEYDLEGDFVDADQMLDEMQETGYAGTELGDWGFLPTDPGQLASALARRDLSLLGGFVPVALTDAQAYADGEAAALRTARLLSEAAGDTPFLVLADDSGKDPVRTKYAGRIRPQHILSDDAWEGFANRAERIARSVREETGLRTVFHHHCASYVETPVEIERLLSLTDKRLLGLCLDTGHFRYGGGEPVQAFTKYGERIWHVHFKDCSADVAAGARKNGWDYFEAVGNGVFCELGEGDVDFPAVVAALDQQGYEGWIVVEQDVLPGMGTPRASARRNRAYLHGIGL